MLAGTMHGALLGALYLVRPARDALGVAGGVGRLPWLFTATFVAMLVVVPLHGALACRVGRARLLALVYRGCALVLIGFGVVGHLGLEPHAVGSAFYVFAAVFNLFVVSVFWSFAADLFSEEQARRMFGPVALGGSLGALLGPLLAALLAPRVGVPGLMIGAALLLELALAGARRLRHAPALPGACRPDAPAPPVGGTAWSGLRDVVASPQLRLVAGYLLLMSLLATFLYLEQARIIAAAAPGDDERAQLFAWIDFGVNAVALSAQALITGRLIQRRGIGWTLAVLPVASALATAVLGLLPVLPVLALAQIGTRGLRYGTAKPAREVLYTGVDRDARYKAKAVLDLLVVRGGDAVSAWTHGGLVALLALAGLGPGAVLWVVAPAAIGWAALARRLGARHDARMCDALSPDAGGPADRAASAAAPAGPAPPAEAAPRPDAVGPGDAAPAWPDAGGSASSARARPG